MTYRMHVVAAGVTSSGVTLSDNDTLWVEHGGVAIATVVSNAGSLFITGGEARDTIVQSGGELVVFSGADIGGCLEAGALALAEGGTIEALTIARGAMLVVCPTVIVRDLRVAQEG